MSDNMKFLADALAYHTKGRKAFMESKCSCCNHDPCDCPDDCDCKKDVKEEKDSWKSDSGWNKPEKERKDQFGNTIKDKNMASHLAKTAKNQTKDSMKEGADEVNDKNINAVLDKDETETADNTVKMTNDIIAGKQPFTKAIKSVYEPAKKTSVEEEVDELLTHAEDIYEMVMTLDEMLKEEDMSLSEAFEALSEEFDEDMLEEDFAKMSKTKQMIARRRAGRKKKLTVGYKLNKKPQFGK